jgi:hypothetical protein
MLNMIVGAGCLRFGSAADLTRHLGKGGCGIQRKCDLEDQNDMKEITPHDIDKIRIPGWQPCAKTCRKLVVTSISMASLT